MSVAAVAARAAVFTASAVASRDRRTSRAVAHESWGPVGAGRAVESTRTGDAFADHMEAARERSLDDCLVGLVAVHDGVCQPTGRKRFNAHLQGRPVAAT